MRRLIAFVSDILMEVKEASQGYGREHIQLNQADVFVFFLR